MRRHSILHSTGHGISRNLLYHNLSLDIIHRIPSTVVCSRCLGWALGNLIWVSRATILPLTPAADNNYRVVWPVYYVISHSNWCRHCVSIVLALGCAIVYMRYTIYTDRLTLWRGIENTYGDGIVDIGKYIY